MDLLLFIGIPFVGLLLVRDAIKLSKKGNAIERVKESHATLYSRLAEYGFWTLRHLVIAFTDNRGRAQRFRRALLSLATFCALFSPVLVAAQLAGLSAVKHHTVAFAIGTAVWSFIVESPSLPYRIEVHTPSTTLVDPVAVASIIAALDLIVGGLAIAGALGGASEALAIGAAFVAAGDLVSGLIGLTVAAASSYPFKDPEAPIPDPVIDEAPAKVQPRASTWPARQAKWRGCLRSRARSAAEIGRVRRKTRDEDKPSRWRSG